MTNWKELGEVPDSEAEDGFDSQDQDIEAVVLPVALPPISSPLTSAASQPRKDIWDVPESDDEEDDRLQRRRAAADAAFATTEAASNPLESSPLSSARSDYDLPPVDQISLDRPQLEDPDHSTPRNGQNDQSPEEERSHHRVENPPPNASQPAIRERLLQAVSPTPRAELFDHFEQSQELGQDDEQEVRQAAIRYERSLRPRKPIQEHPYLLENAQYSKSLKSHGVKPWRVVEAERRRRQETTQYEDSERESQEFELPEATDGSQATGMGDFTGDLDSANVVSSSPPKTSPANKGAAASSQTSSVGDTDSTSLNGHDLPSLDDEDAFKMPPRLDEHAFRMPPRLESRITSKRITSPPRSASRKRRRPNVVESDPVEPIHQFMRQSPSPDPLASPSHSPRPRTLASRAIIDISSDGSDAEANGEQRRRNNNNANHDSSDSESGSRSGSQAINTISRRIRGVLPASWLRLDQQSGRDKVQKRVNQRHHDNGPDREHRRGVAQLRQALPGSTAIPVWSDESDEEAPVVPQRTTDDIFHNQTNLALEQLSGQGSTPIAFSDDGGSVVEEDVIDPMGAGRKRQLKLSDSFRGDQKRPKTGLATPSQPARRKQQQQPKITSSLHGPRRTTSITKPKLRKPSRNGGRDKRSSRTTGGHIPKSASRAQPSPRLSILDIIEPDAPRFLKIAARTARKKKSQGRTSPRGKSIKLATRRDHVDAASVLNAWKSGSIQQRSSVSASIKPSRQRQRTQPLAETSGNSPPLPRAAQKPHLNVSRKFVKHISEGGSVSYRPSEPSRTPLIKESAQVDKGPRVPNFSSARPAQLEMQERDQTRSVAFHSRKKLLDRIYRRNKQHSSPASSVRHLEAELDAQSRATSVIYETSDAFETEGREKQDISTRRRFRKKYRPRRIDIAAPQYTRVADPLPTLYSPEPEAAPAGAERSKLLGLGPYGTQYPIHFEAFPLDSRVYFHESTLIGSGIVHGSMSDEFCRKLWDPRLPTSFTLGTKILRWGPWSAQISSELGIVLDSIAEQLDSNQLNRKILDVAAVTDSASFILRYVQDSLSFAEEADVKSFMARAREALSSFNERIRGYVKDALHAQEAWYIAVIKIYDRLLLVAWLALIICRSDVSTMSEQFQMEGLLKDIAGIAISTLLKLGTKQVRKIYEDLNGLRCRERGLREDTPVIHSWVVVMQILEHARIPRTSFWDIAHAIMAPDQLLSSDDAREYELMWENMFTLLPLVEFNTNGVVISGRRYDTMVDGWALPQKLLRRVFSLYQENTRQSPSFNNYCRALVGRCHYLAQQWGWQRGSTVIGVIFDFFGSQNFAHLRNEESYKSPRFLEELAGNPKLELEPEDRCFHVFLKLVALSIRKLSAIGSTKDIRNLVARTIPNHNRQHLKEQNVHERDLAALRNHHDLLATLFWASPPEMRPAAGLIERLVVPASSHKEACLISLRTWSQLARFVVASGEATTAIKPFNQWRNNFFQQTVQQYDSVASDIQQQHLALSKDVTQSISPEMVNAMISMNKRALMDVLHFSVTASLDVIKQAPDLESATFCLNTLQLQQIFKQFSLDPLELDWAILRPCLDTLDSFLSKVDEFKENEESQQSESQILISAQSDDALLVVDHDVSRCFFSMARHVLSSSASETSPALAQINRATSIEQVVKLSARMAIRFINGGLMRLSDMFKSGKYRLFDESPHKLSPGPRRYLVLFVSTLLQHGWDDFADAEFTLSELWMLSLVKPREYFGYEEQLAEQFYRLQKGFMPDNFRGRPVTRLDYNSSRGLFEFAISAMRRSLRDAGPSLHKILLSEHSKTLKLVMEQIKGDLKTVKEHQSYVTFVQEIVSLIKAHGSEIATVDEFFCRISKEYSPSTRDPQLHVAGLLSYGHRLMEGDNKVGQPLFFLLFNNAKYSMTNDTLREGVDMLHKGMRNQGIMDFVLGKMLPAIIRAGSRDATAFPLLDIYVGALHLLLSDKVAAFELGAADLEQLCLLAREIVAGMSDMRAGLSSMFEAQVHVTTQLMVALNLLWPSILVLSASDELPPAWDVLRDTLQHVEAFARKAEEFLEALDTELSPIEPAMLFAGLGGCRMKEARPDSDVDFFTENILQDIRKGWKLGHGRLTIQVPGKTPAKEIGIPMWRADDLVMDLTDQLGEWRWWWVRVYGEPSHPECLVSIL